MLDIMNEAYAHFQSDPPEVQREWKKFTEITDKMVGEALRQTVKKSLQELSRAINGDAKSEPQALFKVNVVLENNTVAFRPTMINLTQTVNMVSKDTINVIGAVPRIVDAASDSASYHSAISSDEDLLKILVHVMNGMSSCATELQKYLNYWDKYRPLWEVEKDAFIRRYAKANQPLMKFDIDITKYKEQQTEIQHEEISTTVKFTKIDSSQLKGSLNHHCVQWQNKLTGLSTKTRTGI